MGQRLGMEPASLAQWLVERPLGEQLVSPATGVLRRLGARLVELAAWHFQQKQFAESARMLALSAQLLGAGGSAAATATAMATDQHLMRRPQALRAAREILARDRTRGRRRP